MTEDSGSAEETAAQRRERLKALREAQQLLDSEPLQPQPQLQSQTQPQPQPQIQPQQQIEPQVEEEAEQDGKLDMRFRNYLPRDKKLQENRVAPPELPKFDEPVATAPPVPNGTEDPIVNIAPKKPNWDLRRDVQKKLDKLDRRTQRAIIELMQEEEKRRQEEAEQTNQAVEED